MPVVTEEERPKGVAAFALDQIAIALQQLEQSSELLFRGRGVCAGCFLHQGVQALRPGSPESVLAEMIEDRFGGRGGVSWELLIEPLPPGVEFGEMIGAEQSGECLIEDDQVCLRGSEIPHGVKHDLQVVRQRPTDTGDDLVADRRRQRKTVVLPQPHQKGIGLGGGECLQRKRRKIIDRLAQQSLLDEPFQTDRAQKDPANVTPIRLPQGSQPMLKLGHSLRPVVRFRECEQDFGHLVNGDEDVDPSGFDLPEDFLDCLGERRLLLGIPEF